MSGQMVDAEIKRLVTEYINGSDHPDLVVYRRDFDEKFDIDRWLAGIFLRCEEGGFFNKTVLEVGAGFGWDAAGISLAGRNRVVATDILPSMIEGMSECLQAIKAKGKPLDIEPVVGDICNLDLPEGSFDGIFSSEAIEHVHDLDAMWDRCFQLLRPGGRMVIFNDSNRLNTDFRESTLGMWAERDRSWEHARWLEAEIRPIEHKDCKPYAAMREAIIVETAPDLDETAREEIVAATAGLVRPEIVTATETYLQGRRLPTPPEFAWCRNPETGEYAERLLDPFELLAALRSRGFKTKLRHDFRKFPHRLLNGVEVRPVNRFLFDKRPAFILVAEKPE